MTLGRPLLAAALLAAGSACAAPGPGDDDGFAATDAPARGRGTLVAAASDSGTAPAAGNRTGPDASADERKGSVFDHPVSAAELRRDLGPLTTTVRDAQVVRGAYSQIRRLADVPKPLRAEGSFLFARDTGLLWRTVKPFASELVITRDRIVQHEPGGETVRVSADQQPAVRTVAALFFAVFSLDFDALESMFQLYSRGFGAGWELGLRPKPGVAGPIEEIFVSGDRHVEQLRLRDAKGEVTEIRLRNSAASRSGLSADEMTVFQR